MFATGEIVGLAEWIIDDACLVFSYIFFIQNLFKVQIYAITSLGEEEEERNSSSLKNTD